MKEEVSKLGLSKAELEAKIEKACRIANAWDFIQALPQGVETSVGEAGGMMSGGQKQRIAIARAIMRDPSILLLDEATSALDTQSERVVQEALDNAAKNRTTIVIAHRLSTIKNADLIVVMSEGVIVEKGTHNELLELNAAYASLVRAQALKESEKHTTEEEQAAEEAHQSEEHIDSKDPYVSGNRKSVISLTRKEGDAIAVTIGDAHTKETTTYGQESARERIAKKRAEKEKAKAEEQLIKKRKLPWARLFGLSQPEYPIIALGVLGSAATGILFPMFSLIFSSIIAVFGETDISKERDGVRFWAIMFVLLAIGAFIANFLSIAGIGTAGEKLTRRLREATFEALLRQEIGFFDEDKHSTGALTGHLAEDAAQVQGLVGRSMGSIVQAVATMGTGLILAFVHGWQLTLIVLCSVPFIGIAGAMQISALTGFGSKTKEAYEDASIVANEVIDQIRTVMTLTKESMFLDAYKANIVEPHRIAVKGAFVAAIGFGIAQGFIFFAYALAFYAGSRLILNNTMSAPDVLTVMFAVIFTAVSAGQASSFAPNYVKAKLATFNIFDILDRNSRINYTDVSGDVIEKVEGKAEVVDGVFRYPSRPDVPVLQGMSIKALPGQTVALVGPSGCGKSTVIAIMERWYDLHDGSASVDNLDVKKWRLADLRMATALVGQEPVLFNVSIRENIMYGAPNGIASQEEIEAAARKANIHDFVNGLPEGYNTIVGSKGGQLSGGQKQRVAIARALIRNPKILLLDEATSALDSESEKVVQQALDAAAKGRTTIVIAHRLSTIQTADHIIVVNAGKVIEQGKYSELVNAGGQFAKLVAAQSLAKTKEKKKN
ncbi:ATP-binding cassette, sub-B (MDR TAP), member 4 [Blyttiomyces sp. JEL0837]|nr:ATP-binding cassette, sub-B (MDR TAP), member 4 [Blyttiomyces sp. JEL0837]